MRYFCHPMQPVLSYHAAHRTRRGRRTRGQSLVEFAVVLPIFLLILSGILDFGFLLYSRMTVISAAREGARVAIDAPKSTPAQQAQIPSLIQTRVTEAAGGLNTAALTVQSPCIPACSFTAGTAKAGDSVKVTVTYQYRSFFPLLFGQSFGISSTVQMVLE